VRVTVDVVIFTVRDEALQLLLVRRGVAPFQGRWALPGGFIREDEALEAAALRELEEEAGVRDVYLEYTPLDSSCSQSSSP
jgi:8-oxo-dGTP diphosphatase